MSEKRHMRQNGIIYDSFKRRKRKSKESRERERRIETTFEKVITCKQFNVLHFILIGNVD